MLEKNDLRMLEELIDEYDLQTVVNALAQICRGEAERLRDRYAFDEPLAYDWDWNAGKLDSIQSEIH